MHYWLNNTPDSSILLSGHGISWDHSALRQRVSRIIDALQSRKSPDASVAILADNSPDWIAIDLATQEMGVGFVPLPSFFTPTQWMHALAASGAKALFCSQAENARALGFTERIACEENLALFESPQEKNSPAVRPVFQKVTFTSGTTSEPKGVCLGTEQQWEVARTLASVLSPLHIRCHLCLLPLAVLLENIAGAYTALLSGATCICPPLSDTGLSGASGFDPGRCLDAIRHYQAESIILLPQMLQALVASTTEQDERIRTLKFVAVGGARISEALIASARAKGFPVYEGYGLSECASVVSLNLPGADRPGSAGKPLANRRIRIATDGEIEVAGQGATRYLGEAVSCTEWMATGDTGHLDEDGFLFIDGRKKNVLITSYGRNVSPEWPESALLGTGAIGQAAVFGDAHPYLIAVLVPLSPHDGPEALQEAVDKANLTLPDYARIRRWISVEQFSPSNGLATANGRPKRAAIHECHWQAIASLYETTGT